MNISRLIKTIVIMVGFGLFTTFANAVPPNKDVNVINTPDVNVVNTESNPVPVTVTNDSSLSSSEYRFVGVTTEKFDGTFGINGAQVACKNQFGDGARMCTDAEVYNTPNLQEVLDASMPIYTKAWVRLEIVSSFYDPVQGEPMFVASDGFFQPYKYLHCIHWSQNDEYKRGAVLLRHPNPPLKTDISSCNAIEPIMCCNAQ